MKKDVIRAWSLLIQLGISMIIPIIFCLFIGRWIDGFFGTKPVFMIIFIIMGVAAGFRSVYMLTKEFYKDKDTYLDIKKYGKDGKEDKEEDNDGY